MQQSAGSTQSLLHLSDPHFGSERPEVVRALLDLHAAIRPRLVIASGDLTQRARPAQFARAGRFFSDLAAQATLAIPGNHDVPIYNVIKRLRAPYADYRGTFGHALEPTFEDEHVLVLGVDTSTPKRRVDGEVSAAQIDRTCSALREAQPQQLRIVVVHQPVAVPDHSSRQRLLHGASAAVPSWVNAGADLILGGHIHLPYVLPLGEHYPTGRRNAWVVHAGTAVSDRLRMEAPNSVNELRQLPGAVLIVRWDYQESSGAFCTVDEQRLLLDRSVVV